MAENSSLRKTFSTSRLAIMLPAVALRSPASTTPWSQTAATIVVACGRSRMAWPDAVSAPGPSAVRPGSKPGECEARKSANDEDCKLMKPPEGRTPKPLDPAEPGTCPGLEGLPANGPD